MFISSFLKLYTAEIMESRIRSQILRAITRSYYSVNVCERQEKIERKPAEGRQLRKPAPDCTADSIAHPTQKINCLCVLPAPDKPAGDAF